MYPCFFFVIRFDLLLLFFFLFAFTMLILDSFVEIISIRVFHFFAAVSYLLSDSHRKQGNLKEKYYKDKSVLSFFNQYSFRVL